MKKFAPSKPDAMISNFSVATTGRVNAILSMPAAEVAVMTRLVRSDQFRMRRVGLWRFGYEVERVEPSVVSAVRVISVVEAKVKGPRPSSIDWSEKKGAVSGMMVMEVGSKPSLPANPR